LDRAGLQNNVEKQLLALSAKMENHVTCNSPPTFYLNNQHKNSTKASFPKILTTLAFKENYATAHF